MDKKKSRPASAKGLRSRREESKRTMKDAIGGLCLVRFEYSGYNLTHETRFFSTDKCLHFTTSQQQNIVSYLCMNPQHNTRIYLSSNQE